MGCCSSRPPQPDYPPGGWGQSKELRALLEAGKKADAAASPAPTCLLSEFATATELDGERMAELYRAGYAMLAANYVHCNKINVRADVWHCVARNAWTSRVPTHDG